MKSFQVFEGKTDCSLCHVGISNPKQLLCKEPACQQLDACAERRRAKFKSLSREEPKISFQRGSGAGGGGAPRPCAPGPPLPAGGGRAPAPRPRSPGWRDRVSGLPPRRRGSPGRGGTPRLGLRVAEQGPSGGPRPRGRRAGRQRTPGRPAPRCLRPGRVPAPPAAACAAALTGRLLRRVPGRPVSGLPSRHRLPPAENGRGGSAPRAGPGPGGRQRRSAVPGPRAAPREPQQLPAGARLLAAAPRHPW